MTWQLPAETRIVERFGKEFHLDSRQVQEHLSRLGFYMGACTGQKDAYTREGILAFQRAWDLIQTGSIDMTLCRVLSFVTAEREVIPVPDWAK
jgi:peptidoglycan hydrolase-like protein with peptidoglycan-binding domain